MREDPDIVLVDEMRDLETVALATEIANTGHLLFGTLHTTTAINTVDRIIHMFPTEQQAQVRTSLSESLKGGAPGDGGSPTAPNARPSPQSGTDRFPLPRLEWRSTSVEPSKCLRSALTALTVLSYVIVWAVCSNLLTCWQVFVNSSTPLAVTPPPPSPSPSPILTVPGLDRVTAPSPYRIWAPTVRPPLSNMLLCKPVDRVAGFLDARDSDLRAMQLLDAEHVLHDIYVHVPFCLGKCSFCAVGTSKVCDAGDFLDRYCETLHRELDTYARYPAVRNSSFGVVYFGGGTPSVLSAEALYGLVRGVLERFSCREATITVEGNSTSFTPEKLAAAKEAGATRVSVGVQSFDKDVCAMLAVPHEPEQIGRWVDVARGAGFKHINLDLILGLPGTDIGALERDLDTGLALNPTSLSVYDLVLVAHTELGAAVRRGKAGTIPDAAGYVQRLDLVRTKLEARGWANIYGNTYSEIREGIELPAGPPSGRGGCLAVGSSACGRLAKYHYVNTLSTKKYVERVRRGEFPIQLARVSSSAEDEAQHAVVDLCFHFTLDRSEFRRRTGKDVVEVIGHRLERLERKGLVEIGDRQIRLTPLGKAWSGRVCLSLMGPSRALQMAMFKTFSEVFGRLPKALQHRIMRKSGRI